MDLNCIHTSIFSKCLNIAYFQWIQLMILMNGDDDDQPNRARKFCAQADLKTATAIAHDRLTDVREHCCKTAAIEGALWYN